MSVSRNALCPCGSGRKYKRCCLGHTGVARFDDEVGCRIREWSEGEFGEQLSAALMEFAGPGGRVDSVDRELFAGWFHSDRELPGGSTPAQRYAARPDLSERERAAAARIAAARLRLYRVLAVEPGHSLVLEDVVSRVEFEVVSDNVSRSAVRWDLLIGRVMVGDRPGLWGATRLLGPSDEPDLRAEFERLAGCRGEHAITVALRDHALAVLRFRPPSWDAEPTFFTLEGDPIAEASARWRVRDVREARARLRAFGGLHPTDPLEIDITLPREMLVAARPELPCGALVIEAGPIGDTSVVPIATVRLEGAALRVDALSEACLDRVIAIIDDDFGDIAELEARDVAEIDDAPPPERHPTPTRPPDLTAAEERDAIASFLADRMRHWPDEPHPELDGITPRAAASGLHRDTVLRLVRGLENGADRARRRGDPFTDVAWMRHELGLEDERAA